MFLTYKYRVKDRSASKRLGEQAIAVNQVWNYCNAVQKDIQARHLAGAPPRKWPSHFDLTNLTSGVSKDLGIHAQTVGEVCRQFAQSRDKARRALRFRSSTGPRRALGWIPFRAQSRRIQGNAITYLGRTVRVFGTGRRPIPPTAKGGAFVEDALGRWWITLQVEVPEAPQVDGVGVGIDLGLKTLATMSDGSRVESPRAYREAQTQLATAQRAGNRRRAKAIHARIANIRRDHLHKATTAIVRQNRFVAVGDISPSNLAKTTMAKAVLDSGWTSLRTMLRYKCQQAGAGFVEVNERFTSQACSCCGVISDSSPKGRGGLGIRAWQCSECGASHDRDVNAALNILRLGRSVAPRADESRLAA